MSENTNEKSSVKKAANLANDALVVTALVMSAVGLGKLAYDTTKVCSEKFKSWKKTKNEK